MAITLNGTTGITTPAVASSGGDTNTTLAASTSVTTPLVTNAGTLALSATGSNIVTASTNGAERMRIDSSGNLLVGTTSVSTVANGAVTIQSLNTTNTYIRVGHKTGSIAGSDFLAAYYNDVQIGGMAQNGTTGVSYNTTSDYRLKENIAPMTGALDKVQALKPCTYTWKATGETSQGFIAHELQEVVPDCVTGEKDAVETYTDEDGNEQTRIKPQGIDTSFLVATLTKAIQEQQAIITDLKARIETLENK